MKKNDSSIALYAYFAVVLACVILLTELLMKVNTPWWLVVGLLVLLGLGSLVPIASRLELIRRTINHLKSGLDLPKTRQRWPDPLYSILVQIQELNHLDQDATELREGWMTQVAKSAAQEERNRLARELHDSIKQQLFSIQMGAATIQQRWDSDPEGARTALADLQQATQEGLTEMNALLLQLAPAPLERVGLAEAVREQCQSLAYRCGASVDCQVGELPADELLPAGWQENLFRIVQEALSNIARHARATKVLLDLRQDTTARQLILRITDNGLGFQPSEVEQGQGLKGILHRVESFDGQVQIKAKPAEGVSIQVNLPFMNVAFAEEKEIQVDNRPNRIAWTSLYRGVLSAAAFIPLVLAQIGIFEGKEFASGTWFWMIIPVFMVVLAGWLTGRFIPTYNRSAKILLSALSGLGVAITTYGLILATPASIQAMDNLLKHGLAPASEAQTTILVIDAALGIFAWTHAAFWILLPTGAGLGAIGGLLSGVGKQSFESNSKFSFANIFYPILIGSSVTYLFGTFIMTLMESTMTWSAMKSGVLMELRILPNFSPFIIFSTPLLFLQLALAFLYQNLNKKIKTGTLQYLQQAHWKSFNLFVISLMLATTSSLFGWIGIQGIPTTTSVFIFGAAFLLITNSIFFLRQTICSRRELSERLQTQTTWLAYVIPLLAVHLPAVFLATLYDIFSGWVLVLLFILLLGFSLAYSLIPRSVRPFSRLSEIRQFAADLNQNWLAVAFSMIVPALPMGSAGLAIISVVIPFVQPLDSQRLPGWTSTSDTISSLLQGDLLIRQPIGFAALLLIALVLVGIWALFTHFRLLNAQSR